MVLIVMFLFFTVYMNMLSRDKDYQDAVIRSNQLDLNKATEQKSTTANLTKVQSGGVWYLKCYISNSGSTPVRIVRVWITNYYNQGQVGNVAFSTPLTIAPGETNREILGSQTPISVPTPDHTYSYAVSVVTSMGNLLSDSEAAGT